MNILYIGQMINCGFRICNHLSENNNVIAFSDDDCKFDICFEKHNINSLTKEFVNEKEIDIALFYLSNQYGLEKFYSTVFSNIKECKTLKQIFFIEEKNVKRENSSVPSLCHVLSDEINNHTYIKSKVISTSAIYGDDFLPAYIEDTVKEAIKYNSVAPNGTPNQLCDCVHIDDFCDALSLIVFSNSSNYPEHIELISGYCFRLKELMECINNKYRQITIEQYDDIGEISSYANPTKIESWSPKHNFINEIDSSLSYAERRYDILSIAKLKIGSNKFLFFLLFFVGFVLVELYTSFIATASDLQFVDLRLLFIVITSLIANKKYGIFSAVLCGASSVIHLLLSGYRWYVLFFHIDNWIPIAIYLITALILCSIKNSNIMEKKDGCK